MKVMKSPSLAVSIALILPLGLCLGLRAVRSIQFEQNCGGRLKRAADANTIELAQQELEAAIAYMDENDLNGGYTSILYKTPDEDVSFWNTNLRAALTNLKNVKSETSTLEKSNILLKLRQTLLDHSGDRGEKVTAPAGISVYPYNTRWVGLLVVFTFLAIVGAFCLLIR